MNPSKQPPQEEIPTAQITPPPSKLLPPPPPEKAIPPPHSPPAPQSMSRAPPSPLKDNMPYTPPPPQEFLRCPSLLKEPTPPQLLQEILAPPSQKDEILMPPRPEIRPPPLLSNKEEVPLPMPESVLSQEKCSHPPDKRGRTDTTGHHEEITLPHLPPDIIIKIVKRGSLDFLVRFKAVSKLYKTLITPQFVKTHVEENLQSLILNPDTDEIEVKSCKLYPLLSESFVDAIDIHHSFERESPTDKFKMIGSSRGILCVQIGKKLTLWNPSNEKLKDLPQPGAADGYSFLFYGFGCDQLTSDYKVIGNFVYWNDDLLTPQTWVYSVKTGYWRRIKRFPSTPAGNAGVLLNGVIYWGGRNTDIWYPTPLTIVSFDLIEENYTEFMQPKYEGGLFNWSLGVIGGGGEPGEAEGGSLVMNYFFADHVELWVMKDDGVSKSWAMMITIPLVVGSNEYMYPIPIHLSHKGEILLKSNMRLVLYNPSDAGFRDCTINNFGAGIDPNSYFSVFNYIASEVSPMSSNETTEEQNSDPLSTTKQATQEGKEGQDSDG